MLKGIHAYEIIVEHYKGAKKELKTYGLGMSPDFDYRFLIQQTIKNSDAQEKAIKKVQEWQQKLLNKNKPFMGAFKDFGSEFKEKLQKFEKWFIKYNDNQIIKEMRSEKKEFKKAIKQMYDLGLENDLYKAYQPLCLKSTMDKIDYWIKKWKGPPQN